MLLLCQMTFSSSLLYSTHAVRSDDERINFLCVTFGSRNVKDAFELSVKVNNMFRALSALIHLDRSLPPLCPILQMAYLRPEMQI